MKKRILPTLGLLAVILGGLYLWQISRLHRPHPQTFDAQRAYQDVVYQVSLGPRTPGSKAHEQAVEYFRSELQKANWEVEVQYVEVNGHPLKNVIARRSDVPPQVILGAHYDSRLMADRDPDPKKQQKPVPGANDGASGAAVLLELGRVLPTNSVPVWLVFFDGEDQGSIPGWQEWSLGAIWSVARDLGYGQYFLDEEKYVIADDHVPFLEAGIPAVDIIDIEYRYWHTSYDTPENVSPVSLGIVGTTLQVWLGQQKR